MKKPRTSKEKEKNKKKGAQVVSLDEWRATRPPRQRRRRRRNAPTTPLASSLAAAIALDRIACALGACPEYKYLEKAAADVRAYFAKLGVMFKRDGRPILPEVIDLGVAHLVHVQALELTFDALNDAFAAPPEGLATEEMVAETFYDAFYGGVPMKATMPDMRTGEMCAVERVVVARATRTGEVVDAERGSYRGKLTPLEVPWLRR